VDLAPESASLKLPSGWGSIQNEFGVGTQKLAFPSNSYVYFSLHYFLYIMYMISKASFYSFKIVKVAKNDLINDNI
jgi:hypothetical protein